jgi:hypothetical protein
MKCRDCKFWGETSAITEKPDYRNCTNPDLLAVGVNDDGIGELNTSPDFGCVQFEATNG